MGGLKLFMFVEVHKTGGAKIIVKMKYATY